MKIVIAYWHGVKFPDLKFQHNETFPYSKTLRNHLIDELIDKGYSVMLRPLPDQFIIWVDNGRFGQK